MKFGKIPLEMAKGAILAHTTRLSERTFRKGHVLTPEDVQSMQSEGIEELIVAQLGEDDIEEDVAAEKISTAVLGRNVKVGKPFTGRSNLISSAHGLIVYDKASLDNINLIDQSVTIATLPQYEIVSPGQLIATIKIIPLAIPQRLLENILNTSATGRSSISVEPFEKKKVGLIMTHLPGMKESILDNTFKTASNRVAICGSQITHQIRVEHDQTIVSEKISELTKHCDIILIFGASAVVDELDVIPASVVNAGGHIIHFGMPVDPGNLLFLGRLDKLPVIGMPGCARSSKLNGFDWVLWRLLANIDISSRDIMLMGAGGLLKEIGERGQPRQIAKAEQKQKSVSKPNITALVLAAGSSKRMGKENKLLIEVNGKPMIQHVFDTLEESQIDSVIVVTGYQNKLVQRALNNKNVNFDYNANYAAGLSSSLISGLKKVPEDADAVLVCLGDMPLLTSDIINSIIEAFDPVEGREICVPVYGRKRGNPILWDRSYLNDMMKISGDVGAKQLLEQYAEGVFEVTINDENILFDVDTPEAMDRLSEHHSKT